jgi:RimJ/RimL family protein N-acetyltransferase
VNFREATEEDFADIADKSITKGDKEFSDRENYSYVLEDDGKMICIGGFKIINSAMAWCWIDLSIDALDHKAVMLRTTKDWIASFAKEHKLRRLQAYVDVSFEEGINFIEHLGFERESIMKNAMPDGDAIMYRRLYNG